jgi:hypothetical protein
MAAVGMLVGVIAVRMLVVVIATPMLVVVITVRVRADVRMRMLDAAVAMALATQELILDHALLRHIYEQASQHSLVVSRQPRRLRATR